jgi:hypothetical protein
MFEQINGYNYSEEQLPNINESILNNKILQYVFFKYFILHNIYNKLAVFQHVWGMGCASYMNLPAA